MLNANKEIWDNRKCDALPSCLLMLENIKNNWVILILNSKAITNSGQIKEMLEVMLIFWKWKIEKK